MRLEAEARERRQQDDRRAKDAEDRAKRLESEMEEVRKQLLRKQSDQEGEAMRRLQQERLEDRAALESLRGELRQVRALPVPVAVAGSTTSEATLQGILKVAESALKIAESAQQAVLQLRAESSSETMLVTERMEALEGRIERRLESWEEKLTRRADAPRTLPPSTGSRIAQFQALHAKETGLRFCGGQARRLLVSALEDSGRN